MVLLWRGLDVLECSERKNKFWKHKISQENGYCHNCSNIGHLKMHVRSLSFCLIFIIRFLKFESASFSNDQNVYFLFDFETLLWLNAPFKFKKNCCRLKLKVHILYKSVELKENLFLNGRKIIKMSFQLFQKSHNPL